jgi:hypothetical protein
VEIELQWVVRPGKQQQQQIHNHRKQIEHTREHYIRPSHFLAVTKRCLYMPSIKHFVLYKAAVEMHLIFARVICAHFSILAAEKSGCVKFFLWRS